LLKGSSISFSKSDWEIGNLFEINFGIWVKVKFGMKFSIHEFDLRNSKYRSKLNMGLTDAISSAVKMFLSSISR